MSKFDNLHYLRGFGNEFESEDSKYPHSLPIGQNNPQKCNYNLFTEQLSGSAFTAPRATNKRSWLYRVKPSVCHEPFKALKHDYFSCESGQTNPNQMRWSPYENQELLAKADKVDFVDGLHTLAYSDQEGCGASSIAIHVYLANSSMVDKSFFNSDGDFLIVPQTGSLLVTTEFGLLKVEPNEIVVIQQGMHFSIETEDSFIRGYVLEAKGNHFELPYLSVIGANGGAYPTHFEIPTAFIDQNWNSLNESFKLVLKFQNQLFEAKQNHSPFNVAAWSGNYTPYKYNLDKFVALNSVTKDHPDPSIFTVLSCPSIGKPGTALADFVIFPPRWECSENTFRPPYYHRNCMTEFMGLIKGQYQAKSGKFAPGGGSLHQAMLPHGPDEQCFRVATSQDTTKPKRVADNTMAFMFETSLTLKLTRWARTENVDEDYYKCWQSLANLSI